ncbi:unnamed protein product [Enterobius vermicularis]|uniref:COesterase domain-containing protein n=1 Tax=Enterobius vermicularis TaxID=51028 RepID=A0A0N4V8I6_ENTVE|nr:unnamed protein product [Enterobius vermicularis]
MINGEFPRKEKSRSVWIEQGLVRGNIFRIGDRHVQIFRGIPYAEPPVGKLRFAVCFIIVDDNIVAAAATATVVVADDGGGGEVGGYV